MDSIAPAIKINVSKELSPQEFQKMLHSWFEEKGLESDLRSYLRLQMIEILKNTEIGRNIVKPHFKSASLAKQAVNLILAEYLIQHNCHYTFSIFNTEINLSSILPEYPSIFDSTRSNTNTNWQFDPENLLNILELIGLPKNSSECTEIISLYYENNDKNSILSCIIYLLCKFAQEKYRPASTRTEPYMYNIDIKNEDKFILHVGQILSSTTLAYDNLNNILREIRDSYMNRKKVFKNEYSKAITVLKNKTRILDKKVIELQNDKKLIERKLVKLYEENMKMKLYAKQLVLREKSLQKELEEKDTVYRLEIADLKSKAASTCTIIDNKQEEMIVPEINMKPPECTLNHCDNVCEKNEQFAQNLSIENTRLQAENEEHKKQIEKLTLRCRELFSEFDICQSKINLLNSRLVEENSKPEGFIKLQKASHKRNESNDVSSDSITEEILKQARQKLKELEEESQEIDKRFSKIVNLTN